MESDLSIEIKGINKEYFNLEFINSSGTIVFQSMVVYHGENVIKLPIKKIRRGLYIVRIDGNVKGRFLKN